jgi:hypothetical protein
MECDKRSYVDWLACELVDVEEDIIQRSLEILNDIDSIPGRLDALAWRVGELSENDTTINDNQLLVNQAGVVRDVMVRHIPGSFVLVTGDEPHVNDQIDHSHAIFFTYKSPSSKEVDSAMARANDWFSHVFEGDLVTVLGLDLEDFVQEVTSPSDKSESSDSEYGSFNLNYTTQDVVRGLFAGRTIGEDEGQREEWKAKVMEAWKSNPAFAAVAICHFEDVLERLEGAKS